MKLRDKSIAVTGGAGFIGSHLIDRLIDEKPCNLVVIDDFSLGKERNLRHAKQRYPQIRICKQDATNERQIRNILRNEDVDVVFNLAVIPLPICLVKPKSAFDVTVRLTSVICELARKEAFGTLVHFSSSEAYGDAQIVPETEDHPLNPTTPYGASKVATDHLVLSYVQTFGIKASIVRPFNIYGPRQNEKSYAGVIPATVTRIIQKKSPIIFGDGMQTRDYTYVTDLAEATVRIARNEATRGKVLNISNGKETTIKELVMKIAQLMNCRKPIIYADPRPGDVRRFYGSNSLAQKLIGFKPTVDLDQGLALTIKWYKDILRRDMSSEVLYTWARMLGKRGSYLEK